MSLYDRNLRARTLADHDDAINQFGIMGFNPTDANLMALAFLAGKRGEAADIRAIGVEIDQAVDEREAERLASEFKRVDVELAGR